jgi:hypothetical protein
LEEALPQLLELGITLVRFVRSLRRDMSCVHSINQNRQGAAIAMRCTYSDRCTILSMWRMAWKGWPASRRMPVDLSTRRGSLGAAHAHRIATAMPRWRHQETGYSRDLALARCQLNAEIWGAAWSAGCAMTLEQAVAYALAA